MKRPDFDIFREMFLNCLSRCTGHEPDVCAEIKWSEVGEPEIRKEILEAVKGELQENYGAGFEINSRLLSVEGPVESAIIQTFHELSTIILMEKINAKIKSGSNVFNN